MDRVTFELLELLLRRLTQIDDMPADVKCFLSCFQLSLLKRTKQPIDTISLVASPPAPALPTSLTALTQLLVPAPDLEPDTLCLRLLALMELLKTVIKLSHKNCVLHIIFAVDRSNITGLSSLINILHTYVPGKVNMSRQIPTLSVVII